MSTNLVITIGRQFGSGGRKVGRLLAEKLDIPYYDKELLAEAAKALEELKVLLPQVDSMDDVEAMAHAYHDQIVPAMAALRKPVDELELLVDKDIWPVPTYGDLMFEV